MTRAHAVAFVAALAASGARADTVLVDESLSDGACNAAECSQVSGGQFVSGSGWKVTSAQSRIVFALPKAVPCGAVEATFTSMDPINSGQTGEYVNIVGIYEGSHGNNWTASGNDEAQIQVAANCDRCVGVPIPEAWRDERLKFKGLACSWDYTECGGFPATNRYLPAQGDTGIDWPATVSQQYTATASWDCSGASYSLSSNGRTWSDNGTWAWHPGHRDPRPHFRHVFIGKDTSGGDTYLLGLVFVRAKITEHSACDCQPPDGGAPADAGVPQDAGARPDAGGPPDGGAPMDGGQQADAGGAPVSDAGSDDTSLDLVGNCGCGSPPDVPALALSLAVIFRLRALGRRHGARLKKLP